VSGAFTEVVMTARNAIFRDGSETVLVFDDSSGQVLDLDLRGTEQDVRDWAQAREKAVSENGSAEEGTVKKGRGRPRLGVVSREVTLLPRHWAWLGAQRGGASAALRRLVDQARKATEQQDRSRKAQDATYRFMSAIGGDLPGYEEAIRTLFAGEAQRFKEELGQWPEDLRDYSLLLAREAFPALQPD